MKKMIDGNALILGLNDWWYSSFGQKENVRSVAIRTVIDKIADYVDKAPTHSGKWLESKEYESGAKKYKLVVCSECGTEFGRTAYRYKYCPECGSRNKR